MSELFWPGDERAGALMSDEALLDAMTRVEVAWLAALRSTGTAPEVESRLLVPPPRLHGTEAGGNPVIPLVAALREALPEPTRTWVHRGLTSQDTLDTALVLCLRDVVAAVVGNGRRQVAALSDLAETHRATVSAARTLTQPAVPTTFGLTAARWLDGVVGALSDLRAVTFPVQAGGAGGTLAGIVAVAGGTGEAQRLVEAFAAELELEPADAWHTSRRPMVRIGDGLLGCVDAWGKVANDVLVRARPEIGELAERAPGGSSTMPHKQNPVLSVLLKRAAITAPFQAATLHACAAAAVDERPDGAWHAEWAALRSLGRLTATAASQAADLVEGLTVRPDRLLANAEAAAGDLLAEQRALTGSSGKLEDYLGATEQLIDRALARARHFVEEAT